MSKRPASPDHIKREKPNKVIKVIKVEKDQKFNVSAGRHLIIGDHLSSSLIPSKDTVLIPWDGKRMDGSELANYRTIIGVNTSLVLYAARYLVHDLGIDLQTEVDVDDESLHTKAKDFGTHGCAIVTNWSNLAALHPPPICAPVPRCKISFNTSVGANVNLTDLQPLPVLSSVGYSPFGVMPIRENLGLLLPCNTGAAVPLSLVTANEAVLASLTPDIPSCSVSAKDFTVIVRSEWTLVDCVFDPGNYSFKNRIWFHSVPRSQDSNE